MRAQRYRCASCGLYTGSATATLELHHLHHRALGRERATDVVALCRECHPLADRERDAIEASV